MQSIRHTCHSALTTTSKYLTILNATLSHSIDSSRCRETKVVTRSSTNYPSACVCYRFYIFIDRENQAIKPNNNREYRHDKSTIKLCWSVKSLYAKLLYKLRRVSYLTGLYF